MYVFGEVGSLNLNSPPQSSLFSERRYGGAMSNRTKIIFLLVVVYTVIFFLTTLSSAQTTKTATLAWDANTETDLKGYRVYRDSLACNQLGPKQLVTELGLVTTYTDTAVPADATVASWNISAINTAGDESTRSNCAEKTFVTVSVPAGGGIVITTIGTTTINATLAAVSDGAGGTAVYELRYGVAPLLSTTGFDAGTLSPSCVAAGACQLTNLQPGTTYEIQFKTRRVTDNVMGPLGPITTLTTANLPVHVPPQAPKGLRVTSNPSPDAALLAWEQPGGDPDTHRVDRLNQTTGNWFPVTTVAGTIREATVPLASTGKRLFRVCAVQAGKSLCPTAGVWAAR